MKSIRMSSRPAHSFASVLHEANEPVLTEVEFGKILALDPDHIDARTMRAMQLIEVDRLDEAFPDLEVVLSHPGLVAYFRKEPMLLGRMYGPSNSLIIHLQTFSPAIAPRQVRQRPNDCSPGARSGNTLNRHRAAPITIWRRSTPSRPRSSQYLS